ncbi:MAG: hypothetical protein QM482_05560 [Sulfurospirillum sp.]
MKRLVLAAILAAGVLNATDFASMSTEDLVAAKGTIATEEKAAFQEEMQSRVSTMTTEERTALGIAPGGSGAQLGTTARDGSGDGSMGESAGGTGEGMGSGMGGFGGGSGGGMGGFGGGSGGGMGKR